jgi:hypothetical protein
LDTLVPFLHDNGLDEYHPQQAGEKLAILAHPTEGPMPSKPSGLVFYMFANQYGLLKIGADEAFSRLSTALQGTSLGSRNKAVMQVYAFTDPNDLLSYPLNIQQKPLISVCNVYVRNGAVSVGFASDPIEAHLNYERNRRVLEAMLNSPANVRLPKD